MNPVTFTTVYDEETMRQVSRIVQLRRQKIYIILYACLTALFAALLIFELIRHQEIRLLVIIGLIVGIGYLIWLLVIVPIRLKNRVKKAIEMVGVQTEVNELFEDHIHTRSEGPKSSAEETIEYSFVSNVWEHKDYFFLLVNKKAATALDKRSVSEEEIQFVRALLKRHFPGDKYKVI